MIDSIDPTTVMKFCFDVATWAVNQPETLETELDQCKQAIHTFCVNNDDPIYQGVDLLSESCICTIKDIIIREKTDEQPATPEVETEVKDEPNDDADSGVRNGLQRPGAKHRDATKRRKDRDSESSSS